MDFRLTFTELCFLIWCKKY